MSRDNASLWMAVGQLGKPSFNYQTAHPGRDSVLATAGICAQFGQRWNANFYYTADFGNQSSLSHMISTGLEWKF